MSQLYDFHVNINYGKRMKRQLTRELTTWEAAWVTPPEGHSWWSWERLSWLQPGRALMVCDGTRLHSFRDCNFATIMNYNVNMWYIGCSSVTPVEWLIEPQRGHDSQVENWHIQNWQEMFGSIPSLAIWRHDGSPAALLESPLEGHPVFPSAQIQGLTQKYRLNSWQAAFPSVHRGPWVLSRWTTVWEVLLYICCFYWLMIKETGLAW